MGKKKKIELPRPELNITAMMDLVLNLITFFVLVSNFASASLPLIEPPAPEDSLARATDSQDRIVISLEVTDKDSGLAKRIVAGGKEIGPADGKQLLDFLIKEVKVSDKVEVDLRVDKNVRYDQVQPVLAIMAQASVKKMNLVAARND